MTKRQFADLRPGDRVRFRGPDPCSGIVTHAFVNVVVAWDDGESCEFRRGEHDTLDLLPTPVEQACR
jgi:hypothetical protein